MNTSRELSASAASLEPISQDRKDDQKTLKEWWSFKNAKYYILCLLQPKTYKTRSKCGKKKRCTYGNRRSGSSVVSNIPAQVGCAVRTAHSVDKNETKSPRHNGTQVDSMHSRLDRLEELIKILHQRHAERLDHLRGAKGLNHPSCLPETDVKMDCDVCIPSIESDAETKELGEVTTEQEDQKEEDVETKEIHVGRIQRRLRKEHPANKMGVTDLKTRAILSWKEVVGIVGGRDGMEIERPADNK